MALHQTKSTESENECAEYIAKLNEVQAKCDELTLELKEKERLNENLNNEIRSQNTKTIQIRKLMKQFSNDMNKNSNKIIEKLKNESQRVSDYEVKLHELKVAMTEMMDLETMNEIMKERLARSKSASASDNAEEFEYLGDQLKSNDSRSKFVYQPYQNANERLMTLQAKYDDMKAKNDQLRNLNELQKKYVAFLERNQDCGIENQETMKQMMDAHKALKTMIEKLNNENIYSQDTIKSLGIKLEQITCERLIVKMKADQVKWTQQICGYKARCDELSCLLQLEKDKNGKILFESEKLEQTAKVYDEMRAKNNDYQSEIHKLKEKNKKLAKRFTHSMDVLQRTTAKMKDLRRMNQRLRQKSVISENETYTGKNNELSSLNELKKSKNDTLQKGKKCRSNLTLDQVTKFQISTLKKELSILKIQNNELKQKNAKLSAETKKYNDMDKDEIQRQSVEKQNELNASLNALYKELEINHNEQNKIHKVQLEALKAENKKLSEKQKANDHWIKLDKFHTKNEKKIKKLTKEVADWKTKCNELKKIAKNMEHSKKHKTALLQKSLKVDQEKVTKSSQKDKKLTTNYKDKYEKLLREKRIYQQHKSANKESLQLRELQNDYKILQKKYAESVEKNQECEFEKFAHKKVIDGQKIEIAELKKELENTKQHYLKNALSFKSMFPFFIVMPLIYCFHDNINRDLLLASMITLALIIFLIVTCMCLSNNTEDEREKVRKRGHKQCDEMKSMDDGDKARPEPFGTNKKLQWNGLRRAVAELNRKYEENTKVIAELKDTIKSMTTPNNKYKQNIKQISQETKPENKEQEINNLKYKIIERNHALARIKEKLIEITKEINMRVSVPQTSDADADLVDMLLIQQKQMIHEYKKENDIMQELNQELQIKMKK